jgi:hypothetical protein
MPEVGEHWNARAGKAGHGAEDRHPSARRRTDSDRRNARRRNGRRRGVAPVGAHARATLREAVR